MTGDDASLYTMLAHGGDGGILASAHLGTELFVAVHEGMAANDHRAARAVWARLEPLVALLFREANPMPIKHCLWRQGRLRSPECRLPLTRVTHDLADVLDRAVKALDARSEDIWTTAPPPGSSP
jgi:4-hydroxy-tetrahydrodipicolinate synthase